METKETDQKLENHVKAGVLYTVSSILTRSIGIITTPIYTRVLTASEYGIAATFISLYLLLSMFTSLNLIYSVGRAKLDFPDDFDNFNGSIQLLSALWTVSLSIVVLVLIKPIAAFFGLEPKIIILLMIYLFFSPALVFFQTKLRYTYKYKLNIGIGLVLVISSIIVSFTMIFLLPEEKYIGKILGSVVPITVMSCVIWYKSIKKRTIKINTKYWKYALVLSLPLIFNSLSLNILAQSDRIMITKFLSSNETGIYSLAYQYAILIDIIFNSVNQAWLPYFHDHFDNVALIRKNTRKLVLLGCYVGVGCIALAPEAISILGPVNYSDGVWVVAPVTIGIVCKFIFQQYEHVQLHLKKTYYIAFGTTIAAIINIVLNLLLLRRFGFVAAGYTTLISYIMLMGIHYIVVNKILKIKLVEQSYMTMAVLGTSLLSLCFVLSYSSLIIRIFMLLVLTGIIIYKFKDEIKAIVLPKLKMS